MPGGSGGGSGFGWKRGVAGIAIAALLGLWLVQERAARRDEVAGSAPAAPPVAPASPAEIGSTLEATSPAPEATPPGAASPAPEADRATPAEVASPPPEAEPTPEAVEAFLRSAIETHLPRHKLTREEIDRLATAVLEIRSLRRELAALETTPENAPRQHALRARLVRALGEFDAVLDMSAAEFTERVQPEVGITPSEDDEPPPPGELLEDWRRGE